MLSRAANNLFWMARYVERGENTARMLDVTYRMSLMPQDPSVAQKEWFAPLNITGTLFPFSGRFNTVCAHDVLRYMVLDASNPSSIFSCAKAARERPRRLSWLSTSPGFRRAAMGRIRVDSKPRRKGPLAMPGSRLRAIFDKGIHGAFQLSFSGIASFNAA
jgi:hypothetical protein